MPAANFFSAASRRRTASSRATRVVSTRFWLVCTCLATSRTWVAIWSSRFLSCVWACSYWSRARARLVSAVLAPIGYDTVTPSVHTGNVLVKTSPSTDP